jgi:hypothetical protein
MLVTSLTQRPSHELARAVSAMSERLVRATALIHFTSLIKMRKWRDSATCMG